MNSRERVIKTINHEEPDRVPIDLGGSIVTGIMAGALVRLRQHLGMKGGVNVHDAFQMLGEVAMDLVKRFEIDVLPVEPESIFFDHLRRRDWKPWMLFDGTPVLVPGAFDVEVSPRGDWLLHADGDPSKPIIGQMPEDGFYFDDRRILDMSDDFVPPPLKSVLETDLAPTTDENLRYLQEHARTLRESTDKALLLTNWGKGALGIPSVGSITQWLILLVTEPVYVSELMDAGAERAVENLALLWQALGDDIDVIFIDGNDYGTQSREMFSPKLFEKYYVPCYRKQCDWIHANTSWKAAQHCCGSIPNLLELFVQAGVDIMNPVQTSARGMDPYWLKGTFGDRLVFWGGGVDTQGILGTGTPEQVREDVAERVRIFGPGGGFVWAAIHNIQYNVPPENIVAAIGAVHEFGRYPMS